MRPRRQSRDLIYERSDREVQSRGRELTSLLDELLRTDNTCESALAFTIKKITHKINEVSDETVEPSDYENIPEMPNKL